MKKFRALFMTFCMGMSTVAFAATPSITKINAGEYRSYAVLSDGSLYTWGYGEQYDTLAAEFHVGSWSSRPVKTDSGILAAGDDQYRAKVHWKIKTDGSYWEDSEYWSAPRKLLGNAVAAENGFVLLSDGTLWYAGDDKAEKVASNVKDFSIYLPSSYAILKQDGSVWIYDKYVDNPFGIKAAKGVLTKFMDGAIDVDIGQVNLYVLKKDGSLWGWGDNMYGQLGKGYASAYNEPNDYTGYRMMDDVVSVEAPSVEVFAIKEDGSLWAWGDGGNGTLGVGLKGSISYSESFRFYTGKVPSPTKVMDDVAAVSTNGHTLILKKDGTLWACGDNAGFAVGDGAKLELRQWGDHSQDRLEPVKISLGITTGKYTEPSKFVDVKTGAYYFEPVDWAVEKNITSGTSSNTFSPDQTCTRGQIITFLWRAAGSPAPKGGVTFGDVDQNMYYAKAIAWAAEKGMADGMRFEPDAPCTREMAVEFMWKYAGSPDAVQADFNDVTSEAVDWAVAEGITSGTSNTTFSPDQTCTRGQIVTFLYRGFGK